MALRKLLQDGWSNVLTNLGVTGKDKRTGATIRWTPMAETQAEALYAGDAIAAKVVDLPVNTAFQKGIVIPTNKAVPRELADDIVEHLKKLNVLARARTAWKWARLYGGAGIFPILNDTTRLELPINEASIGEVHGFTVLNRFELSPQSIEDDITKPGFGLPRSYLVTPRGGSSRINNTLDASRIIRVEGAALPRTIFISNNYWGDSVLAKLYNVLRNWHLANDSAASMVEDFNVGLMKLKDLADLLQTQEGTAAIKQRIEIMNLSKSVLSTILVDADSEDYENRSRQVTGLADLLKGINDSLVAEVGIPATVLLGVSPTGGLSGKGDSENRDWYDLVANLREDDARDALDRMIRLSLLSKSSPTHGKIPEGFTWNFAPLWQMDEKEIVGMRKTQAETDGIYLDRGVLSANDVTTSRFGGDQYSIETKVSPETLSESATLGEDKEAEEEAREANAKALEAAGSAKPGEKKTPEEE